MTDHVLVPTDGSEQARAALEYTVDHHPDAAVTLLCVVDPVAAVSGAGGVPTGGEQWYRRATERAEGVLAEAAETVAGNGRTVETVHEVGAPARTIVQYAADHDVDHVVMGSHGRSGVARVLLGSVAETVVRRAPVPVTVVR